jgi:hypothetical protein
VTRSLLPRRRTVFSLSLAASLWACAPGESEWVPLFNGRDLDGWTPKIAGYALGEDPMATFRVEDGLLTVGYERYGEFGGRFGHLFYEEPYDQYRLLVEYRFISDQAPGGESWALRNSGVMLHAQAPETMPDDQDFPISVEVQFLGGNGTDERPTGNVCTPGTEIEMDDARVAGHCTDSSSRTYHGDEWVTTEITVLGDSLFIHVVEGDTVLTYGRSTIGGGVVNGYDPAAKPDGAVLDQGYIALQSESHPIQFRRVLLQRIGGG